MKLHLLLTVLLIGSPALATEALKCPGGAQVKRDPSLSNGKRNEWCEDTKTSKPHGAARIVDAAGTVLLIAEFQQGQVKSRKFTRAGLDQMLSEVNAGFAKDGQPLAFSVIDEQTLRLDVTFAGRQPGVDAAMAEEFHRKVVAERPVCRMLAPGDTDFRTVRVFAQNEKRESLFTVAILRAECEQAASAN